MKTILYRHFDKKDNLLYVGISKNAMQRLSQHSTTSHWFEKSVKVTMETFDNRQLALKAEKLAIKREMPEFNVTHAKCSLKKSEPTPELDYHRHYRKNGIKTDLDNPYVTMSNELAEFHYVHPPKQKIEFDVDLLQETVIRKISEDDEYNKKYEITFKELSEITSIPMRKIGDLGVLDDISTCMFYIYAIFVDSDTCLFGSVGYSKNNRFLSFSIIPAVLDGLLEIKTNPDLS